MAKTGIASLNVAYKRDNELIERKYRSQGRKHVYRPEMLFAWRKRIFRAKTSPPKAKTQLPSANVVRKGDSAFILQKRSLQNAKKRFPSENIARQGKNALTDCHTSIAKAKTRFPSGNVALCESVFSKQKRRCQSRKRLPSENVSTKSENAVSERKAKKCFHPAKTSLPNATTRIPSGNVGRKGKKAFVQRKRISQNRKRVPNKNVA